MVTYVFLPVACTKFVQTMQNQFLSSSPCYEEENKEELTTLLNVRGTCPWPHFSTDPPIPTKIC